MSLRRKLPLSFLLFCAAGAGYIGIRFNLHEPLGPRCELKEQFALVNRPAYWHHCLCWGLKYNENPPPAPDAAATRCFGLIRKSWTDTDEIALKMIADREQLAKKERFFEKLTPDAQSRVKAAYQKLREGIFRNDYTYMLEQTKVILLEVEDYGDTRALDTMAREALEKQRARAATPVLR